MIQLICLVYYLCIYLFIIIISFVFFGGGGGGLVNYNKKRNNILVIVQASVVSPIVIQNPEPQTPNPNTLYSYLKDLKVKTSHPPRSQHKSCCS